MTNRYSILHNKLQELETQLNKLRLLPPQTQYLDKYAQDIEQRLEFFNTLFSAELVSNPQNPHHLLHIGKRLEQIESVFREWNESCLNDEDEVVDSGRSVNCLGEEKKISELREDDDEQKGISVGGGMKLATAMAGGVLIGIGVMGFIILQSCHCSPYNPTATFFTPT